MNDFLCSNYLIFINMFYILKYLELIIIHFIFHIFFIKCNFSFFFEYILNRINFGKKLYINFEEEKIYSEYV